MHSYGIGWLFCSCGFLYNIFFKTQFWQVNKEKKLLLEGVFTRMLQKILMKFEPRLLTESVKFN